MDNNYDHYTMRVEDDNTVTVYGWTTYEKTSVLAGQPRKVFLDSGLFVDEAREIYPGIEFSSQWTEPQISLSHLPGEEDPVPGGMYPDDL